MAMTLWIFGVSASARFLLWAQRVRDDAQTGRPKTIRPALALANIGAQPGFVVINAFLRTKALKRSPVPHEAELAMAVSAVIFHDFLSESAAARANRQRRSWPRYAFKIAQEIPDAQQSDTPRAGLCAAYSLLPRFRRPCAT